MSFRSLYLRRGVFSEAAFFVLSSMIACSDLTVALAPTSMQSPRVGSIDSLLILIVGFSKEALSH